MKTESTVIVPWDFSKHAHASLKFAYEKFGASQIRVICVLERPNPYDLGVDWGQEAEDKAQANCAEDFAREVSYAKDAGIQFVAHFGEPADEVVRFADRNDADFIVMSTHGRTGIQRLIMGSVAQKIASISNCPILLLPNNWFEKHAKEDAEKAIAG